MSVEAVARSFSQRLALNHAILKNKYWMYPVDDKGVENYSPVGRGVKSSEFCGRWVSLYTCKNHEGHKDVSLEGEDCTDKIVTRHQHMWCHKSSCPVCFINGWANRGAHAIENRINEGVRLGYGKPEHITVSVPKEDKYLPEPVFRKKCRDALDDRGVKGGEMTFHGFRIDRVRHVLYWSPHYHCVAFIEGDGFDVCRDCEHDRGDCASCLGFKGREVRGYAKDHYLVKVHEIRKTIYGTAKYNLHHATIRVGVKRFQSVTWFGCCSYNKFKAPKLKTEVKCPACRTEMVRSVHVGKRCIVKDIGSPDYVPWFVDDEFDASGLPNYIDVVGGGRVE